MEFALADKDSEGLHSVDEYTSRGKTALTRWEAAYRINMKVRADGEAHRIEMA